MFKKINGQYIIYEIIHHANSKSETAGKYTIRDASYIESIKNGIEEYCKNKYEGTWHFDFSLSIGGANRRFSSSFVSIVF